MTKHDNHPTNFWFGFALGSMGAAAAAYLMGTKKGRSTLKKWIELSEDFEVDEDLFKNLQKMVSESGADLSEEIQELEQKIVHEVTPETKHKPEHKEQSLENVMDKIRHVAQPKYVKKFFAKSGKIIDP